MVYLKLGIVDGFYVLCFCEHTEVKCVCGSTQNVHVQVHALVSFKFFEHDVYV